ncbi:Acetoin catabolism regulatory protein (fragment) [Pseudomonas inefficax]|uniref:Acetoin catabolism regulatory protein n=1 Tax=Pseudomonas inefficax TaxID=2078786 RepID=A0AAQ1P8K2_9PSED
MESELFGYDTGAFTGAHQKGNPGLIRKAHHGILFLDEIGDMPFPTQARPSRALQTRSIQPLGSGEPVAVDIRVVSASNRDLAEEVRAGRFRQDLFYRIAGLAVVLPPLRERSDRRQLIEQVHARYRDPGQPARLPAAVIELLDRHPWPGNMRELVSVLQVALALAGNGPIGLEHLPAGFLAEAQVPLPVATEEVDLHGLVEQANGNLSAVARGLGISRTTLYKRLRER